MKELAESLEGERVSADPYNVGAGVRREMVSAAPS